MPDTEDKPVKTADEKALPKKGYIYIIRCTDNSLYTGITTNPKRRIAEHRQKTQKSAKYMRGRTILSVEAIFSVSDLKCAGTIEYKIKRMLKADKERVIDGTYIPDFLSGVKREEADKII